MNSCSFQFSVICNYYISILGNDLSIFLESFPFLPLNEKDMMRL